MEEIAPRTGTNTASDSPPTLEVLATELLAEVPEFAAACTTYLVEAMPELRDAENLYWEETRSSTEANLDQVARLIRAGKDPSSLVVPVETALWVRGLVHRGISLPALLRAFRLGHSWLWARWSETVRGRITNTDGLAAINEQLSAFLFAYIDRISDVLVDTYGTERDQATRSSEQRRTETVRAILAGTPLDADVASQRLGYDLRRHHVALRITSTNRAAGEVERATSGVVHAAGLSEPLVVAAGMACTDVWIAAFEAPGPELAARLEAYEPPDGVSISVGNAAKGPEGFRASHDQARHATRIATLSGSRARAVTTYRSVELVSLLAADLPRAKAFAEERLAGLAGTDAATQRLRETVLLFLNTSGSASRTAQRLFIHQNTVAYRVKRAEELLGRRIGDRPTELACALTLVEVLGPSLLAEDDIHPPTDGHP